MVQNPPQIPVQLPQRSAQVPISTNTPWRLEQAIQASRESAARIRQHKEERRKALEDLHATPITHQPQSQATSTLDQVPQEPNPNKSDVTDTGQIETILAAIMEFAELDPSSLEAEDEPRTWEEAKCSPDYLWWKVGYSEELKSLKDMQVYVLVPRCDVSQGHKIRKGHPISKLKGMKMERLSGGRVS